MAKETQNIMTISPYLWKCSKETPQEECAPGVLEKDIHGLYMKIKYMEILTRQ